MIVVAIIGISAAIAIPAYRFLRSLVTRITEGLNFANSLKLMVQTDGSAS